MIGQFQQKNRRFAVRSHAIMVGSLLLVGGCLWGCGGDDSTPGSPGSAGVAGSAGATSGAGGGTQGTSGTGNSGNSGSGGCRFEQPACYACLGEKCSTELVACYGTNWQMVSLCSATAKAATKCNADTIKTSQDGLKAQTDYGGCVLSNCLSSCDN
jgi:hypothetical protein